MSVIGHFKYHSRMMQLYELASDSIPKILLMSKEPLEWIAGGPGEWDDTQKSLDDRHYPKTLLIFRSSSVGVPLLLLHPPGDHDTGWLLWRDSDERYHNHGPGRVQLRWIGQNMQGAGLEEQD
ncbi:hypothetical protein DEU56DRAFT_756529 [Suillus clintonianus]|nr:uncharacterized protein DEU56DRAFT_756529 [Suillus clintonianus]KAG2135843.1 hypothetical protein DEU56DRAFT_756529 [Suillus clintonianus]